QATSQDPRIGVEVHAYAWKSHTSHDPESRLAKPKCAKTPPSLSQPRIGVEAHAYACEANSSCLKLTLEELNVTPSLLVQSRATHMRRTASICVEGKLSVQVFQDPRMCVEASICMEEVEAQPKL
ncbi:hypothetical protein PIB30_109172, partial [Stylosanthes scabra]|nr:hypothetical protein [Stylosanthes scabra]